MPRVVQMIEGVMPGPKHPNPRVSGEPTLTTTQQAAETRHRHHHQRDDDDDRSNDSRDHPGTRRFRYRRPTDRVAGIHPDDRAFGFGIALRVGVSELDAGLVVV